METQVIIDPKYRFMAVFNKKSGVYVRTGILDQHGRDTQVEPFMASFPHLIDVGIMGHCEHGKTGLCLKAGVGCYQSGYIIDQPNMSLENFRTIAEQCRGRVNQFALGGRGDPDQHESFAEILETCAQNGIVPNYTTSGYGFTKELALLSKKYCGAVAVSWYRNSYTTQAIEYLLGAGVKTNIHYVLSRDTIDEAIERLQTNDFPKGLNAVIFLLHKLVGLGQADQVLSVDDPRLPKLFELVDRGGKKLKIGFDSCSVPAINNFSKNVVPESIEPCEGGRFSCYISPEMMMMPCSFDQEQVYAVSLKSHSMEKAWKSSQFEAFRQILRSKCPTCQSRELCLGGCPLKPEIVLCSKEMKTINEETK